MRSGNEEEKIERDDEESKQDEGGTRRQYGGKGMGISISKELSKEIGGRIVVKEEVNEGKKFNIILTHEINKEQIDERIVENKKYEKKL